MTTATLEHARPKPTEAVDDGEFMDFGWRPIFKEHVNREGQPFDGSAMKRIAERNNARIQDTGDYCPIVIRHTVDDGSRDPEVIGFYGPYRAQQLPPDSNGKRKWAVYARERIYKADAHKRRKYPRVSVEYWADADDPTGGYFDPASLLGAETPELDLGIHYAADPADPRRTLMRYKRVARYEAAAVAPGGSNTFVPGGTEEPEKKTTYQAGGTLSDADLKQIIQALGPVIQEAVKAQVGAMQPMGADPDHLLTPEGEPQAAGIDEAGGGALGSEGDTMGPTDDEMKMDFEPGVGEASEDDEGDPYMAAESMSPEDDEDEGSGDDDNTPLDDEQDSGKKKPAKKKYAKQPSDDISPSKARQILEDGEVNGHPLTDKQRKMFGAASHYEKMTQYMADGDEDGADQYWKDLDDEDREHVRHYAACESDDGHRTRMSRYMAGDGQCTPEHGDRYMADNAEVARYQKEAADYRKKNEQLANENAELKTKYQKAQERIGALETSERKATRYQKVEALKLEGIVIDPQEEVDYAESLNMDDAAFDAHLSRCKTKYTKIPTDPLAANNLKVAGPAKTSAENQKIHDRKVERYSKVAMDNVQKSRKAGNDMSYKSELDRLMAEDPEKLGAA